MISKRLVRNLAVSLLPVACFGCAAGSNMAAESSAETPNPSWVQTEVGTGNVVQVCGDGKIAVSNEGNVLSFQGTSSHGEFCHGVFWGNNLLIGLGKEYSSSGFEFSYEAQVTPGKGLEIDAFTKDSTYHVGTKLRQNGQIMFHAGRNPTTFGLIDEGAIGQWTAGDTWVKVHVVLHDDNTFSVLVDDKPALTKKPHSFGTKTITSLTLLYSDLGGKIRNLQHKGTAIKG